MQGALKKLATAGGRGPGYTFDIKIRILIPNADAEPDVIATEWAHRVDRRVADAQEEGFVTYKTQRQYIVPEDLVRTLEPESPRRAVGFRYIGEGAVGGDSGPPGSERLGSNARPRFVLHDTDEGRQYAVAGVQFLPGERYIAIVADRDVV